MENKIIAFLFCDGATKAPDGKVTLYGIFDEINGQTLPIRHQQFSIYWKIFANIQFRFKLVIEKPDSSYLFQSDMLEIHTTGMNEGVFVLGNMEFSSPGDYKVKLLSDDKKVLTYQIMKINLKPKKDV